MKKREQIQLIASYVEAAGNLVDAAYYLADEGLDFEDGLVDCAARISALHKRIYRFLGSQSDEILEESCPYTLCKPAQVCLDRVYFRDDLTGIIGN